MSVHLEHMVQAEADAAFRKAEAEAAAVGAKGTHATGEPSAEKPSYKTCWQPSSRVALHLAIVAFLEMAVWSAGYSTSISSNKLIQIPLKNQMDTVGARLGALVLTHSRWVLGEAVNKFVVVNSNGQLSGLIDELVWWEWLMVYTFIAILHLLYQRFSLRLLLMQLSFYNPDWKADGEEKPSFGVLLRVRLLDSAMAALNYNMANYTYIVFLSSIQVVRSIRRARLTGWCSECASRLQCDGRGEQGHRVRARTEFSLRNDGVRAVALVLLGLTTSGAGGSLA